jgi:hypothetical protein
MVFNVTFNNILVISCWSVLLVEETGVPGENHQPVASHWQNLSHNVVSNTPRLRGIWTHVSGDRINRKKNCHNSLIILYSIFLYVCEYCAATSTLFLHEYLLPNQSTRLVEQ